MLLVFWCLGFSVASALAAKRSVVASVAGAFSAAECEAIEKIFENEPVEVDQRENEGISRRNYWLKREPERQLRWVLERIAAALPQRHASGFGFTAEEKRNDRLTLEFALMHEFLPGDFFDWHVDTKPGDGTMRTTNVNVILSRDFEGGQLQLGDANATLGLGDLHAYPAALPHKVHDIKRGRRRTLVLALKSEERHSEYFDRAADAYADLCETLGSQHPKLHWIFGDFYEAQGLQDQARAKYADSYRSTPERLDYLEAFAESAAQHHGAGNLQDAKSDLQMCLAIQPDKLDAAIDLAVLLWSLNDLKEAENTLKNALLLHQKTDTTNENSEDDIKKQTAALRAVLSFILDCQEGRTHEATQERLTALDLDPDIAQKALASLHHMRDNAQPPHS